MNLFNLMGKPGLPNILAFQPAGLLGFPSSVEVTDRWSNTGSGVGGGTNSIRTALGEYFERRHFYKEIVSKDCALLSEFLGEAEVKCFVKVFLQATSRKMSSECVEGHRFEMSKVVRVSDFSTCYIPAVFISLSWHGLEKDSPIYPLRDTCGCSFHWDPEVAFFGAIKEHMERQFLLRFWLTKKCNSLVCERQVKSLLENKKSLALYEALSGAGEVSVLDISDHAFPGVCILTVYGQRKEGHHVRYCAGMSFASGAGEAIEKSLFELWQTFRFVDLFVSLKSDERKIKDAYLRHFLKCNSYATYLEVTDVLVSSVSNNVSEHRFDFLGLRSALSSEKITGYLYSNVSVVEGVRCVFCKYISPDLFMHMNNAQGINIENKYSEVFKDSIVQDRLRVMVPFP